ncbi:MAG: hypothetical protein BGO67_03690 [Alphaproteobacteria bacterium 41-28]|nr:MAG: hypothetical protein BGO67_03690 [Alphaproteobacteria bacterium 41-28]
MSTLSKLTIRTSLISSSLMACLISPLLGLEVSNTTNSKIYCFVDFGRTQLGGNTFAANDKTPWHFTQTKFPECDDPQGFGCFLRCGYKLSKSSAEQRLTNDAMAKGCFQIKSKEGSTPPALEIVSCQ